MGIYTIIIHLKNNTIQLENNVENPVENPLVNLKLKPETE